MGNDANDGHLSLIISGARLPSMMIVIGSGSSRAEQSRAEQSRTKTWNRRLIRKQNGRESARNR